MKTRSDNKEVIREVAFVKSSSHVNQCPDTHQPEFAFIGRSNVGKSSLINMICGRKNLAKTSGKPGKTKLINHFLINNEWFLVDLPGYGYASVSKKERNAWPVMINKYLGERENLCNLFVLIDSRISPQAIDLEFIHSVGEAGIPMSLVFTKADKLKPAELKRNVHTFLQTMKQTWEQLPPHFITSSQNGTGRNELLTYVDSVVQDMAG
ncbi:MAG: YihA family ribosome biogenesis GTP-binding protein [Flavobacteriales bacterium]|nr:YihA family ribosome biogenesis GTP-binding protein [Flavobacteriales bacterium]MCB9449302.1 YihA family ribosome biogenesis GTP-binding protein [Flavobacteriales bacterium]